MNAETLRDFAGVERTAAARREQGKLTGVATALGHVHAHEILLKIQRTPKVFVAAISGHALGGGLEIALACDFRFAAEGEYRIGLPEAGLGLLPGNGGTQRLTRLIGRTRALDMMLTSQQVGPARALELGIVDRVFAAALRRAVPSIPLAVSETPRPGAA